MKWIFDMPIHITVHLSGRCKACNALNEKQIYDYGRKKYGEVEKEMDSVNHEITPLICSRCGSQYSAEFLIYRDQLSKREIIKTKIDWGNMISAEEHEPIRMGHDARYDVFKDHEDDFWEKYYSYALADFRKAVNELNKYEFEDAYSKMGIDVRFNTVNQYRKDALNRFTKVDEKCRFWREANHFFIYDHMLELGPLAWQPEKDVKQFGENRTRFVLLHFPLAEELENLRTSYIGEIIKKDKGDNEFLFRRIQQLSEELNRVRKRNTDYYHQIEKLKMEVTEYQRRLNKAYEEIEELKQNKQVIHRDPADISKINELKSFVSELLNELSEKNKIIEELSPSQPDTPEPVRLEEVAVDIQEELHTDHIRGKTIGIIGGKREGHTSDTYVCDIITHSGQTSDPAFYQTLKEADYIVVLTRFISHEAMWEAKAYALSEDKPIFFTKHTSIPRIIEEVAKGQK